MLPHIKKKEFDAAEYALDSSYWEQLLSQAGILENDSAKSRKVRMLPMNNDCLSIIYRKFFKDYGYVFHHGEKRRTLKNKSL